MLRQWQLILMLLVTTEISFAQNSGSKKVKIGDQAPALSFNYWSKGQPVAQFQNGQVYVLEFWASWCKPCLARMPQISALAKKFSGKVHIIGVDVYETDTTAGRTKAVVDSLASRVAFPLATDDAGKMVEEWMKPAGQQGIPVSFIIDQEGRIAWIGYPTELDVILPKVVGHTWDVEAAIASRHEQIRLDSLSKEMSYQWAAYGYNPAVPGDRGKPDSLLVAIDEFVRKEPKMEMSHFIFGTKFGALLNTDQALAWRYAKQMRRRLAPEDFDNDVVFLQVGYLDTARPLIKKIYKLSIGTLKARIDESPTTIVPEFYHLMASFYSRLGRRKKAVLYEEKAIAMLKKDDYLLNRKLPGFVTALRAYRSEKRRHLRNDPHIFSNQFL